VEIPLNTRIFIQAESILKFGLPGYGLRAYLSVSDGFSSEKVLNSFSQHQGITTKETLEKGDELMVQSFVGVPSKVTASVKISKDRFTAEVLEVYKGPEFNLASKTLQKKLIETRLTVTSDSNRMAYMLKGWEEFSANEIITAPVQPGTVQLTPSGQCIVLMRDAQTTGGYARVLQLTEKSINRLAQKNTGTTLNFKLI
jgi:allophanate hydrolase subunit 2